MIPKIEGGGGRGTPAQPRSEPSNAGRNHARTFIFRAETHYARVILSGLTN
jgi:hypothetical protein